jgi:hypothetical protein
MAEELLAETQQECVTESHFDNDGAPWWAAWMFLEKVLGERKRLWAKQN